MKDYQVEEGAEAVVAVVVVMLHLFLKDVKCF
jgi:hypothetical protein